MENFPAAVYVSPDFAVAIVKACVGVNHFVRERDGYTFEGAPTVTGWKTYLVWGGEGGQRTA
jgi:hypothetical protein